MTPPDDRRFEWHDYGANTPARQAAVARAAALREASKARGAKVRMTRAGTANAGPSRAFSAFAPRPRNRVRATTWWGLAWVRAMEQTSLDPGRLQRGRTYANAGRVFDIVVTPGLISTRVQGSRAKPYDTSVQVHELDDSAWERFLDEVSSRAGHIAALLDKDMPHDLVDAAAAAGVPLLPQVGDLVPQCSCPDWGYPCKHAAALCNQAAWLLDEDPFVLLLMRGRGEEELLAELTRRNEAAGAAAAATAAGGGGYVGVPEPRPAGTPARTAYSEDPAPMPDAPPLPEPLLPGSAPVSTLDPVEGVDPAMLELLVRDAAGRALAMLGGEPDHAAGLDEREDLVRLGAEFPEVDVARPLGVSDANARAQVNAWRWGGRSGLHLLSSHWSPSAHEIALASKALEEMWEGEEPPRSVRRGNRWTFPDHDGQLRLSPDGLWYPYVRAGNAWHPAGPPSPDVATALSTFLTA